MKLKIYEIVRKYFPENEFALMQEVRSGAGFNSKRSADYIAMNLWPSRGLSMNGIELKSYRSDWIKELKQPEKADEIFKYCDYWWLLTSEEGVAKLEEIPENWGWLHIHNGKIKVMKNAPKLSPCAISKDFLACLLKRASSKEGYIRTDSIQDQIKVAKESAEKQQMNRFKGMEDNYNELRKNVNDFQNFTGIDLALNHSWRKPEMEKIGAAVNVIVKNGTEEVIENIKRVKNQAESILKGIEKSLSELKAS